MVKQENLKQFFEDVLELAGFMMAQEIARNPLTPIDTGRMSKSFPATFKQTTDDNVKWEFQTPFYTKFVHEGTRYMQARPFLIWTFNAKFPSILKKSFRIKDAEYRSKNL